jgi:hypothetical protein
MIAILNALHQGADPETLQTVLAAAVVAGHPGGFLSGVNHP